ncbi:MAG: biotin-dependent carboxylase-like uncharacterized protein [Halieaceae bacterium]|jgi:biotin-dependent carboxylase-like uncharacterized protein
MALKIIQPGILSLLQDSGRYGKHRIGLTNGGPLDTAAFQMCNRLLGNDTNSTVIEVSFGGLQLETLNDTYVCITGAAIPLNINGKEVSRYRVHPVQAGDTISLDYASNGCRAYFGVADGFQIPKSFGSTATVVREDLGGLSGGKLQTGDELPSTTVKQRKLHFLPPEMQPHYRDSITVRVIPGYQQSRFNRLQQRRFFSSAYTVSDRCDRMGYRLEGPAIRCDIEGILSEGICHGAIQIPADGQPIVLLNDRQTIGGYPKIGSALSLDAALLAQLTPGATVHFTAITSYTAHNALNLAARFALHQRIMEMPQ